jgi:hypothetical protein
LAIAAAAPTMPISPIPLAPAGPMFGSSSLIQRASMLPTSALTGMWVLGQVVVEVVAELAVEDAFLVQRHRHAPNHAADELGAGQLGVHDLAGGEDSEHPRDADFPAVHVDPHLGELGAERVPRQWLLRADLVGVVAALLPAGAHYVKAFGTLGADALAASANRDPLAVLFYATDDNTAAITIERLIRMAGFEPWKAGGVAAAGRIEAPGGDLHQYGFNGEVVDINRARSATGGSAA